MQQLILTLMVPVMTLIFAAVFVAFWWQDRAKIHILAYAVWFILVAVGLTIQTWLIPEFGPTEVVLFHLTSTTGLISLLWGIAKRDDRRIPLVAFIGLSVGTGVVLWFASSLGNSAVLIMAQNFNAGLLFCFGAYGKWTSGSRHVADRCLLTALILLAGYSIFRPSVTILIRSQMTMAEYQSSALLTFNVVMTALLCLIITICLLATILADNLQAEREEATIDPLSGLPNRRAFEERVKELLSQGADKGKPVSLIVGDIDHFKRVNDNWGHAVGDRAIGQFGQMIAGKIRGTDLAGRIGGEEFCILVWDCNGGPAARLADRIRQGVANSSERASDELPAITASFGVAEAYEGESYATLFQRADSALYKAKREGRNRVILDRANTETDDALPAPGDQPDAAEADGQTNETKGAQVVSLADRKSGRRS